MPNASIKQLSIPSKAFLLGEYAVLDGAPGIVSTFAPRFTLNSGTADSKDRSSSLFHPESPAGLYLRENAWEGIWNFTDPHKGAGGFGGSTAEFLLAYAIAEIKRENNPDANSVWDAWTRYKKINPTASGVDLVAQWLGGTVLIDTQRKSAQKLGVGKIGKSVLFFSAAHQAARKVRTHEHLKEKTEFTSSAREVLVELVKAGGKALTHDQASILGEVMNEYGDTLRRAGLEISATTEDRKALAQLPGVLGVKGTGALQADGLVVVLDPAFAAPHLPHKENTIRFAEARNLVLVCSDISTSETGILIQ
jgi:mevalonate kinase